MGSVCVRGIKEQARYSVRGGIVLRGRVGSQAKQRAPLLPTRQRSMIQMPHSPRPDQSPLGLAGSPVPGTAARTSEAMTSVKGSATSPSSALNST